jgi:DNA-binding winged helix-turn-helix (wHTH) protein
VRFAHFDLDSDTRQLLRDGEDVHLSPKAFAVLSILLAKRPNVVAKADLFGEIWPDVFVVDANLNVLVGEIRRALDDDAQSPRFIRTVHGVGYAFCGQAIETGRPSRSVRLQPDRLVEGGAADVRFWLAWKNQTFSLEEGDNIIGRDPRCEVWVDHSGVSRRHARIRIEGGESRPVLTDLESTNGTFVAGKRITEATPLTDGDAIKVGSVTLKFREWTEQASRTKRIRGRPGASDERS